jgi:hypothetical protein
VPELGQRKPKKKKEERNKEREREAIREIGEYDWWSRTSI